MSQIRITPKPKQVKQFQKFAETALEQLKARSDAFRSRMRSPDLQHDLDVLHSFGIEAKSDEVNTRAMALRDMLNDAYPDYVKTLRR
jgi:hypothetical protein